MFEENVRLQWLMPGYRYQFADDPSGYLMRDFVLRGTWAGIMEFLEEHQDQAIENNSSCTGIYMAVEPVDPYKPVKRFKVSGGGTSVFVTESLRDFLSIIVPLRNPVVDLVINAGELDQKLKSLHEDDDDDGSQKPTVSPWAVFDVVFSMVPVNSGYHLIGERSVDFGSIRRIL